MINIKVILRHFGLSAKESEVYFAALRFGTCSITQLSRHSGLKRPTVYLIIDDLLKKDLLLSIPSGRKIFYKVQSPEKLVEILEYRKRSVEQVLPELQNLYQAAAKEPKVLFYEGKDQLKRVYEKIFKSKEIWAIFSPEKYSEVFTAAENRHFFNILIRHGGMLHDLLENTKKAHIFAEAKYRTGISETQFLPRQTKVKTDILVFDDKVALISFNTVVGVIVEDTDIAATHKTMIQALCNRLK